MFAGVNLIAEVVGLSVQAVFRLRSCGFHAVDGQNVDTVFLPNYNDEGVYFLPGLIKGKEMTLLLESSENSEAGRARLICGVRGQPLKIARVEKNHALNERIYYFRSRSLATVEVVRSGQNDFTVEIHLHNYEINDTKRDLVTVDSMLLFEGKPDELPADLVKFSNVIEAGVSRASRSSFAGAYFCQK